MPNFTISIPIGVFPEVQFALLAKWDYKESIGRTEEGDLIPNPESQNDFLRRKLTETVKGWYRHEVKIHGAVTADEETPDSGIEVT